MSPSVFTKLSRAGLVAGKDLLVQFQSPVLLVFLVVMPLAMILITGLAFKGLEPRGIDTTVAVIDEGNGPVGPKFAEVLRDWPPTPAGENGAVRVQFKQERLGRNEAEEQVRSGRLGGAIFVPADATAPVQVLLGPDGTLQRSVVESAVDRLVYRVQDRMRASEPRVAWQAETVAAPSPLADRFSSFSQAVAGNGVMFILLNCIMSGALGLIRERRAHTLDRLLIAPLSRGTILSGKILGVYALGVLQALVIFGFGLLVLRVEMRNLAGVVLVTLVFILVGCSLGLMISALARREENVQMLGGPIGLVMAALGGGMFPVEMAPPWMQRLALVFPTGWAMQAYHLLMWDGASVLAVVPHLLVLGGFAAGFFVIGTRSLRWE